MNQSNEISDNNLDLCTATKATAAWIQSEMAPDNTHDMRHGGTGQAISADAIAQSFVMRNVAPALANLEIRSARLAGKVADSSLSVLGSALSRVGAICSAGAERTNARRRAILTQRQ